MTRRSENESELIAMAQKHRLMDEPPINFYPSLAVALGVNEAIIFQQLHFLLGVTEKAKSKYNLVDGRWWVYNSYKEWQANYFPWIHEGTIKRLFLDLEERGLVSSMQSVKHASDRRKWYTINYEAWEQFELTIGTNCSDGSMEQNVPVVVTNCDDGYSETTQRLQTENTEEKHIHIEKPNNGFSRVSPEHPQAQQPSLSLDGLSVPDAENGSQHEKAKKPRAKKAPTGNPNTLPILDAYLAALGYQHVISGVDRKAAKTLADAGYLPEQVTVAYKWLSKQEWWRDQPHISLMALVQQIGGVLKKMGYRASPDGSVQTCQPPKPNYLTPENLYT